MTALFWRSEPQRRAAQAFAKKLEEEHGREVTTRLLPLEAFWRAEHDHQKYVLRRHREFEETLLEVYPDPAGFVDSTAAARLNGYLARHGSRGALHEELPSLGLSPEAGDELLRIHGGR